jgi:glycosyltransferase involved in cell wall biosynthesis
VKVAIVHDWFCNIGGAEECVQIFTELFPAAPIYTLLVYDRNRDLPIIRNNRIHTSFVQKLPFAGRRHQEYLPLFPTAIEQFDLTEYDLVISSSSSVAKGAITTAEACHICYCHTPMRYAWHLYHEYMKGERLKWLKSRLIPPIMNYIRTWDAASSRRVDHFVANSECVRARIRKYYGRESQVIYPPVDTGFYTPGDAKSSDHKTGYFVTVGRLVAYKNVGKMVAAFSKLGLPLKVVGTGPEQNRLESLAGSTVEILGYQPKETVRDLLRGARAFVFCAEEDFGIAPVEAQATGTPVIAYGKGGALETVIPGVSGVLFEAPEPECIAEAVTGFRGSEFDPRRVRDNALRFDRERFREEFGRFALSRYSEHTGTREPEPRLEAAAAA